MRIRMSTKHQRCAINEDAMACHDGSFVTMAGMATMVRYHMVTVTLTTAIAINAIEPMVMMVSVPMALPTSCHASTMADGNHEPCHEPPQY
jgi:hypothetical protein